MLSNQEVINEYDLNEEFKEYADKCCNLGYHEKVSLDEVLKWKLVNYVAEMYRHRRINYKKGDESE